MSNFCTAFLKDFDIVAMHLVHTEAFRYVNQLSDNIFHDFWLAGTIVFARKCDESLTSYFSTEKNDIDVPRMTMRDIHDVIMWIKMKDLRLPIVFSLAERNKSHKLEEIPGKYIQYWFVF